MRMAATAVSAALRMKVIVTSRAHVDAEHRGQGAVLGDRLHRPAELGARDEQLEGADHHAGEARRSSAPPTRARASPSRMGSREKSGRERQGQRGPELLERVADEQAQADGGDDEGSTPILEQPGDQELP